MRKKCDLVDSSAEIWQNRLTDVKVMKSLGSSVKYEKNELSENDGLGETWHSNWLISSVYYRSE